MTGAIALVGSGEFTPQLESVDRELLAATGRSRPRVAILPTASIPDGEEVFQRWVEMGRQHFTALGAEVEPVLVRDRDDAQEAANAQAIGEADLVYLSGGKPDFLYDVIAGTAVERALHEAHERGAVLAGCSAGAMVLADRRIRWRRRIPFPPSWQPAFGFVARTAVAPHYDAIPEPILAAFILTAPRGGVVLGIDENTALVGRDGAWQVMGAGRVTVWRGRRRTRHHDGELVRL
ncbi:MAG TPA: Type 1 glutamine amidotransferase-like domain-containing protein [Candidatus Limnocylindrales bacterium]|jgi:cyanophycinase